MAKAKFEKGVDYVQLYIEDKRSMLYTMYSNMASDLFHGYDPLGQSMTRSKAEVAAYEYQYVQELEALKRMDSEHAQRWAYNDMIKRGAID